MNALLAIWKTIQPRKNQPLGGALFSHGYGADERERAGAYRVYQDPQDLLQHLDEVGVRRTI